jgi:hypothetical protein
MSLIVLVFRRRPPQRVEGFAMPASKNQNNFRLPHALQATLMRRVVPAPQRCATHFLRP